jgi:hypothetical protein
LENSTKFLYRQIIIKYLYMKLNRQPTEDEIIAEAIHCGCLEKVSYKAYLRSLSDEDLLKVLREENET